MSDQFQENQLNPYYELELAALKSHEKHMGHIYGIRWAGLALSALTILIGAVMVFLGLEGSFNWAVEAPNSISAKLTNASPGIVFATVGLIVAFVVILQRPVNYNTGRQNPNGTPIGYNSSIELGGNWRPLSSVTDDDDSPRLTR